MEGNTKDINAATNAAAVWNSASGIYEYKVHDVSYKINFKLTIKEARDPIAAANADALGNSFSMSDNLIENTSSENNDQGHTKDGKHINVKTNRVEQTDVHEFGHTLGLGHFFKGFMATRGSRIQTSMKVTLGYVQQILRNNGLGVYPDILNGPEDRDADPKGKSKRSENDGLQPENFRNGEVQRVDGNINYIDY